MAGRASNGNNTDSSAISSDDQDENRPRRRQCWHQNDTNSSTNMSSNSQTHRTLHQSLSDDEPPPLPRRPPPPPTSSQILPQLPQPPPPTTDSPLSPVRRHLWASFASHPSNSSQEYYDDDVKYERPNALTSRNEVIPLVRLKDWKFNNERSRFLYQEPRYEIDLLLIGKTGQGKSALGNSILGRKAFESKPAATSVTKSVAEELIEYKGYVIKVVDGPGVEDTDMSEEEAKNMIIESLSGAITINLRGYHAFLLVVKFGERFTRESRMTIEVLKKVFGGDFVKKFCILVMTYGDQLDDGTSFREWLSEQKGEMMDLVKECNNRVILFDNKTKEKEKKFEQLDALLDIVQMLTLDNGRYTNEQFGLARLSRDAMMLEPRKWYIEEESMKEASLILERFQSCQADKDDFNEPKNNVALDELLVRTQKLLNNLTEQDKNTGVLKDLIHHVESLQNSIKDEIRLLKRIAKIIEKETPKRQEEIFAQIRRQKTQFYLSHVEGKSREQPVYQNAGGSDTEQSAEKLPEIEKMKLHWEKSQDLDLELKNLKNKKKSNILKTFQKKVLAALKKNMKEERRSVDKTNIPELE
ncbi:Immune-associated nucleotide-binding protein 8 [Bulinus truncatus]|nr:Immune-associated nucleotide-binding protein 8 [Bulinus truncatus]